MNQIDFNKDIHKLGGLFYAAGSKKIEETNETVGQDSLTELDDSHRVTGSELINLIAKEGSKNKKVALEVATLLRHPFFTQNIEEARSKLKENLCE